VDGCELLHRLDLYDKRAVDDEVRSEAFRNDQSIVVDRDRLLPIYLKPGLRKHGCQNGLINAFEQARAEVAVKFEAEIDRGSG